MKWVMRCLGKRCFEGGYQNTIEVLRCSSNGSG
jgi:hypothetical protein